MEIVEEKLQNVWILKPVGRIDASCSGQIKDKVLSLIDTGQKKLLIDLGEVDFIDSSGLGTLVSSLNSIKKAGGKLKICDIQENPKQVFEMTRLDRVFEVFDDRDEALDSF
jgi:anti-sigma B factor antagonist